MPDAISGNMRDMIRDEDLIAAVRDNGGPFLPICFCLDTSKSMRQKISGPGGLSRLETLQNGLDCFYREIFRNPDARDAVHASIVTFDTEVKVLRNFAEIKSGEAPRVPLGEEGTAMGPGVNLALDMLEAYCDLLKKMGATRYPPYLILMSDGLDTIGRAAFNRARARIRELVHYHRLCVFPFGIGPDARLNRLSELSPEQNPLHLEERRVEEMFKWLGMKIGAVSSSGDITQDKTKFKLEEYEEDHVESWEESLNRKG